MNIPSAPALFGPSGILSLCIFLGVLAAVFLGRYIGHRTHSKSNGVKNATDDTLIGSILGLMALVVAFTFSGAAGRLDQRERFISAETTAISSAYAAIRYIGESDQDNLKSLFAVFVAQRSALYEDISDFEAFLNRQRGIDATINQLQDAAYGAALKVAPEGRPLATEFVKLVNAMGSAYTNQLQAIWFHPPRIIWISLIFLVLIGSFLAGYKMGITQRRERLLSFMFAALISCAIYLILSLEFPLMFRVTSLESDARQAVILKEVLSQSPTSK